MTGMRVGLAAVGLAAGAAVGQPPGAAFERARAMQAVADQKAEADVRQVVRDADLLAKSSPPAAAQRLRRLLASLDSAVAVSGAKRAELAALLQEKVAAWEAAPRAPAVDPAGPARRTADRTALEAAVRAAKDVQAGVDAVERAYRADDPLTARRLTAHLAARHPDHPAVAALRSQTGTADALAAARALARDQERRTVAALDQVARAALPAVADVEYPDNWKDIVAKRNTDIQLEPEVEAILRALDKRVTAGIKDGPFLETVQTLSNLIGKEIFLDKRSLEDAGLDLQRPVTMPAGVSARTALRAVLQAQGLTFVIRDRIIQVVTIEKAREALVTRAYYLGGLVQGNGPLTGGAVAWGPAVDAQQTAATAQLVVDSVKQSIDPLIWADKGGPATVLFHAPSLSLIVRAPAEVHAGFNGRLSAR